MTNEKGASVWDFLIRFREEFIRYLVAVVAGAASLFFGRLATKILSLHLQVILVWVSLSCGGFAVLYFFGQCLCGIISPLLARKRLEAWFEFTAFRPPQWFNSLALQGQGKEGVPQCEMSIWNPDSGHFHVNQTYYTNFLDTVYDYYGRGNARDPSNLRITTFASLPWRVMEQATFYFYLEAQPHRVRIVIGNEMDFWKRKRLLRRLCETIMHDVQGAKRLTWSE